MNDIETNPLSAITAKAKETWKKSVKQEKGSKSKSKSSKQKLNKKRSIKQIKKHEKSDEPQLKKRKLNSQTSSHNKKKIDFDLSLEEQKKRSVIKLQNMPTGLEEDQISIFFNQFGHVTRFCLKRHRYGRSLRYGYVEFNHPEIAKVVENTLDCTSMYGQMIVCKEIPPEKVNGSQFFKTNSIHEARCFKKFENEKVRWNKAATIANLEFKFAEWHKTLIRDENVINNNLKKHGVNYEFHGFEEEMKRKMPSNESVDDNTSPLCAFLSDDDSD